MKHARLPASAAHRRAKCPASAYLDTHSGGKGSKFAAEGTAAHALAEDCLRNGQEPKEWLGCFISVTPTGDIYWTSGINASFLGGIGQAEDWHFTVDAEMVDAVNAFLQATQDAKLLMPYPVERVYVEEKTKPSNIALKDTGGSLDWACVAGTHAAIADLKYGRGVVVDVVDNPQQLIYALGLLNLHPNLEQVESFIVQPRAPHIEGPVRSITYTRKELDSFEAWLIARVEAAQGSAPITVAGEHCRFCPALSECPEVFEQAKKAAAMEFAEANSVNLIAEALELAPIVEAWVKAVRKEALKRLLDEVEVPGWKLVHGRSSRDWTAEEQQVIKAARRAKLLKSEYFTKPKLLSPPAMEKAAANKGMTKKGAYAHFVELYEVSLGGPTIAPDNDPRAVFNSNPEDDFEAV